MNNTVCDSPFEVTVAKLRDASIGHTVFYTLRLVDSNLRIARMKQLAFFEEMTILFLRSTCPVTFAHINPKIEMIPNDTLYSYPILVLPERENAPRMSHPHCVAQ